MIPTRKPGDNITIMETLFFRRTDPADNKYKEYLTLVYKDNDSGLKYVEEIVDPDYEYFVAKEDKRVSYPRLFIAKEDAEKVVVPYCDLEKDIAKRTGNLDYFYENIKTGNRYENKRLHIHPDVFNSDMNIEDHYRYRFGKTYVNDPGPISKAFFDIEVDTISMKGDFPEYGECPINAVSLILQDQKQVYVFLLRNDSNPLIQEFEDSVNDGSIFPELTNFVIDAVGGPAMAEKYGIDFKYNFLFYDQDDEINLIKDLFMAINTFKPDFVLAWNMGFDIPYTLARISNLGYDPASIVCHPDFKNKIAQYFVDERMKSEFSERGDRAFISSYSVYLDQMIHFASRRKGQSKFASFTLDAIGEAVAKVRKLDYKHITSSIAELPYKDYKTFVFYNIMDTIVQHCIEAQTGDMTYVFGKCIMNNTRYSKCHRQTVYLMNRGIKEFDKQGFIMGNNVNKFNTKPDEKFPGAFVADPQLLDGTSKLRIFGRLIDVFDNLDDFDYASLYPSVIREFNIAAHTQIGRIMIENHVHNKENMCKADTHWTRAAAFTEDMISQVWTEICHRWFHLSDYATLYHEIEEFFTHTMAAYNGLRYYSRTGLIDPLIPTPENSLIDPLIIINDKRREVQDVFIQPDITKWEAFIYDKTINPNQRF